MRKRSDRVGMALVLVLCFLALTAVLVVAFVSGITGEVVATRQDDGFTRSRQLAELAANVVMGQIRQATTRGDGVAWVSQPGMIRTYGTEDNGASPAALADYKLYSSNDMEVTVTEINGSSSKKPFDPSQEVPAGWASLPAQFTDLNAPATGEDGVLHYPILDPAAASGTIAGLRLTASTPATASNAAPMPVRWIYVLRDGTLTSSASGSVSLSWTTTASTTYKSPSRDNPIIGRIAFWTDDECCKVNINTASEGMYWDVPRANAGKRDPATGVFDHEKALAAYQPVGNEWQRYPGHPATTSLSTVLGLSADEIYSIVPKVNRGGSEGGTAIGTGTLTADRDRLYFSVDELAFNPAHTGTSAWLRQEQVERARFCLTAHSRAPEVNLFGKPRIACWPITSARKSGYDQSAALCSTLGGNAYYFQREDPNSATHDIGLARNQELYSYLNVLTSIAVPGYGTNFASKYPQDRAQILTEIFDYIRSTNLEDPGSQYAPGGWVIPTRSGSTMGFGRAFTLSGLAVGFICNADGTNAASNTTAKLASGEILVQAVVVPDLFCVMQGWSGITGDLRLKMSGLSGLKVGGKALYASDSVSIDYTGAPGSVMAEGRSWGGAGGWRYFAAGQITPSDPPGKNPEKFPLVSQSVRLTPEKVRTMSFTGATIKVQLCSRSASVAAGSDQVYQTITVKLPSAGAFPVPKIVDQPTLSGTALETTPDQWWTFFNYGDPKATASGTTYTLGRVGNASLAPGVPGGRRAGAFFREEYDTVRGVVLKHGDFRLIAGRQTVDDSAGKLFVPLDDYDSSDSISCLLGDYDATLDLKNTKTSLDANRRYFASLDAAANCRPCIAPNAEANNRPEATGDFDNGVAAAMDGPYLNKPDEGNTHGLEQAPPQAPYFFDPAQRTANAAYFSPNRIMPSPGMFGSLPSCVVSGTSWRTLLFRPQGDDFSGGALKTHPATAAGKLPDHLFLDLFWMPVVEPYAISEPFSTAGKVNLNYQIVPFTYIERSTALRAVLKAEKLGVISNSEIGDYKTGADGLEIRKELDVNANPLARDADLETLKQFTDKFAKGELFKSASEICDLHLVPADKKANQTMADYWNQAQLTGDNLRERIYTTLYPRLTTRSNTFTVHYRVQALQMVPFGRTTAAQWATWNESKDKVLSECRGSTLIERYVDPNQRASGSTVALPDFAKTDSGDTNGNGTKNGDETLDDYYRFRVVSSTRFAP